MSAFMEMKDGQLQVTTDPTEVERLLNERTGTTPEQRRQMQEHVSRQMDERLAYDRGLNAGFANGIFFGFVLAGFACWLVIYLFGSPIKGVLL